MIPVLEPSPALYTAKSLIRTSQLAECSVVFVVDICEEYVIVVDISGVDLAKLDTSLLSKTVDGLTLEL